MGSIGSAGRVMGALWARAGTGLSAWKGFSGESQGEDVDEEKEETSLDCWLSAKGGERSRCTTVSAEEGDDDDGKGGNKSIKGRYEDTRVQLLTWQKAAPHQLSQNTLLQYN